MRQRGGSEQPVKGRRANVPKAGTIAAPSITDLQKQVGILTHERDDALEQQRAAAEVLKIISASPTEFRPVLEVIVESAARFCDADDVTIFELDGQDLCTAAHRGPVPHEIGVRFPCTRGSVAGRTVIDRKAVHVIDLQAEADEFPEGSAFARRLGQRTTAGVPLLREGVAIGTIQLRRAEVNPFTDKQIALLGTFADQAVIAIENARLLTEQQEALDRQTATAEVLEVINSSPGDLAPVFEAMLEKATRLCGSRFGTLWIYDGERFTIAATHAVPAALAECVREPVPVAASASLVDIVRGQNLVHMPDLAATDLYHAGNRVRRAYVDLGGARTTISVALRKDNALLGAFNVFRQEVRPFSDKEIALVQNFAAQAVIAIENARLLNETKEALERQTATADVLRVIASSPSDLQPVFEAIATRSTQLVGGHSAAVSIFVGDMVHLGAFTPVSSEADAALKALYPRRLADYPLFKLARGGEVAQVSNIETDTRVPSAARASARARGFRSLLLVPMNSDSGPIGVITVTRKEPGTFAAQHIQLLQTFADQAVIAIENARLFDEVQAKTRDLEEALVYQTGSSNILKVIASSPGELKPVFQALLENATRVCGANFGTMYRYDGAFHLMASHNAPPALVEARMRTPVHLPPPDTGLGRLERTKQVVH